MQRTGSHLSRGAAVLVTAAVVMALGCGDSTGLSRRYKVSGTVTYKGAPVEKGSVSFSPSDPNTGRAATGTIEGGSYSLTTATPGDGALPGDYKVTIVSTEVDYSAAAANAPGGSMRQDDVAKANKDAKSNIPAKYGLPETSGLSFKVEKGSNTANFELKD